MFQKTMVYKAHLAACLMSSYYVKSLGEEYVTIETQGGATRGVMLVDRKNFTKKEANAICVIEVDHLEFRHLIETYIGR